MEEFRLAVIGSRNYNNYNGLKLILDDCNRSVKITHIISGGANGADKLGARWAKENNIELVEYYADWDTYDKLAGYRRNTDIIEDSQAVIAFWDMKSKGTEDSIIKASVRGLDVFVVNINTGEMELIKGNNNA